ncbi:hypothetical protein RBB79_17435 [Tunturiibacter empetritectus]|uniref:Uncharacterized protein n=1 Tax=Tunturiibacter lichenicola TaxID=2051959 RepID=A0A852VPY4_9BACT|nr:hypothetical protein [Edaphobacter lichenicola]NYF91412.1 hypothetical protein [Edaphobacter lichenicola]
MDRQLAQPVERGNGWPWNGYALRQMKKQEKFRRHFNFALDPSTGLERRQK